MSQKVTVFGTEVTVDTVKVDIVAIGDGYSVTAQVILDDNDVLVAITKSRTPCRFEEAASELVGAAVAETREWMAERVEEDPPGAATREAFRRDLSAYAQQEMRDAMGMQSWPWVTRLVNSVVMKAEELL